MAKDKEINLYEQELSPADIAVGKINYELERHKKYQSDKYPAGQDNVIRKDLEKPLSKKPVEMPGDFQSNTLTTPLGDKIKSSQYTPFDMSSKNFSEDAGQMIKEKQKQRYYKAGGKVKSASDRADGCAIRGRTRA